MNSAADIRIGDLWGKTYAHENKGTSSVISFTKKGDEIISRLSNTTCFFEEVPNTVAIEGQMAKAANSPWVKSFIFDGLRSDKPLKDIAVWCRIYQFSIIPQRAINKFIRIVNQKTR